MSKIRIQSVIFFGLSCNKWISNSFQAFVVDGWIYMYTCRLDVSYGCAFPSLSVCPFFVGLFVVVLAIDCVIPYLCECVCCAHGSFLFIPRTVKLKRYVISIVCFVVMFSSFAFICREQSKIKPSERCAVHTQWEERKKELDSMQK